MVFKGPLNRFKQPLKDFPKCFSKENSYRREVLFELCVCFELLWTFVGKLFVCFVSQEMIRDRLAICGFWEKAVLCPHHKPR